MLAGRACGVQYTNFRLAFGMNSPFLEKKKRRRRGRSEWVFVEFEKLGGGRFLDEVWVDGTESGV